MGGHTQLGEFATLDEAVKAWKETVEKFEGEYKLWFKTGQIIKQDPNGKYQLSMRFTT